MNSLTVSEFLERQKTERTVDIARSVGISETTLQRRLNKLGYSWDNSGKVWKWSGEGDQPTNANLLESSKVTQDPHTIHPKVTINSRSVHPSITDDSPKGYLGSPTSNPQFTQAEIADLKQMLSEWREGNKLHPNKPLLDKIRELPNESKKRKTVIVLDSVGEDLDKMAKEHNLDKSDIYNLALIEFFQKYK